MTKYKSIALWPEELHILGNRTEDFHDSHEAAMAICQKLQTEGFGGDRKVFPIKTFVEKVNL